MDAHLHQPGDNLSGISDDDLLSLIDAGTVGAYAEFYRRHLDEALTFASAALNSTAARDAVNDAFLSVLTSILTAGSTDIECLRDGFESRLHAVLRSEIAARTGSGREVPGTPAEAAAATAAPLDPSLVATALSELPDNWQRILWLREVERLSPRAVADHLGITPTAVTQLNQRARRGLQGAWLGLRSAAIDRQCRETIGRLGDYVSGRLGPLRRRTVRSHLAGCADCSAAAGEVAEISKQCRAVLTPALLTSPIVIERLADTLAMASGPGAAAGSPVADSAATIIAQPADRGRTSGEAAGAFAEETPAVPVPATPAAAPAVPVPAEAAPPADPVPASAAAGAVAAPSAAARRPMRLPKSVLIPAAAAAVALAATLLGFSLATPETEDAGYHSGDSSRSTPSEAAPAPATSPAGEEETPDSSENENPEPLVGADEEHPAPEPRERAESEQSGAEETHDSVNRPARDSDRSGADSGRSRAGSGAGDERGELQETPWVGPGPGEDPGGSAPADDPSDSAPAPQPPPSDPSPAPEPPSDPVPGADSTGSTPGQAALTGY